MPLWGLLWVLAYNLRGAGGIRVGGLIVLVGCAAAAGAVALVIRRVAEPVADIVSAADRIARRDFRVRVPEPRFGPAWIADIARSFNAMAMELDTQDQARRHLMADVAHELRTPLAILQGKIEGLIDGVYPRDEERLQGVLDDTRLLSRIVDDLGTLASAESGALALSKEPTDIVALAHHVVSSLDARAMETGVKLELDAPAPDEIEPIQIDPLRIKEVLTNLVVNAVRYTPRGGGVALRLVTAPHHVEVQVIDSGVGIPAQELPHVFDRFYKGAGSSGSGLGLTIARNLVEAHGGTIRAESRPGAGTTITFSLPRG